MPNTSDYPTQHYGIPGIGGSLGKCGYCGEGFIREQELYDALTPEEQEAANADRTTETP